MPGREYACTECGHRFRAPDGVGHDVRALMCPGCGSLDITITEARRPAPVVMRARTPAATMPPRPRWLVRES